MRVYETTLKYGRSKPWATYFNKRMSVGSEIRDMEGSLLSRVVKTKLVKKPTLRQRFYAIGTPPQFKGRK